MNDFRHAGYEIMGTYHMNARTNGHIPYGTHVIMGTYGVNTRINWYIPYKCTY